MRYARVLMLGIALVVLPSCASTNATRRAGSGSALSREILGAWQLVWPQTRAGEREIKLITPTHFTWTTWNTGTHEVLATGGGPYTLVGNDYCEQLAFAKGDIESAKGRVLCFQLRVSGDSLFQSGKHPFEESRMLQEVWVRVK